MDLLVVGAGRLWTAGVRALALTPGYNKRAPRTGPGLSNRRFSDLPEGQTEHVELEQSVFLFESPGPVRGARLL